MARVFKIALATIPPRRHGSRRRSSTVNNLYIYLWLFFYVDGTGAGNATVPSTRLRLFTTIQQMATLHLPTNPNPNPKP